MDITITLTDDEWAAVQAEADIANASNQNQPDFVAVPADQFFIQQVRDRIVVFWQSNQARLVLAQKIALVDTIPLDTLQTAVAQTVVSPVALPPVGKTR